MKILETITSWIAVVFFLIVGLAIYALIFGAPVMWLWNQLMPTLFHLPEITFWQAFGLYLLCGFLFKDNSSKSSS